MRRKQLEPDMHILILINSLTSGGAERVTVNLSAYLVKKGHKATVVTVKNKEDDFYTLDGRVARICLASAQTTRTLQSNGIVTGLKGFLRRFTVLCVIVRLCRSLKKRSLAYIHKRFSPTNFLNRFLLFRTLKSFKPLRQVIKQQQPDIILGMMTSNAVRAIFASFGLPTKVVASERNFPGRKKTSNRWARFRKKYYRFADGHVVQTHKIFCWLREHTRASNIAIIPNSVTYPLTSLSPVLVPQTIVSEESKVILAAGKLHEQKGFDLLISAFHRIVPRIPGWILVILGKDAGSKSQRENLQQLIDELDLNDKVKIPGCAGNISDWYQRSDIFVLSSRYEGFPNVLLEAMASGCSCISFDCDTGPSEIIINEQNGLLVPCEDIDCLAKAMERLVKDEKLRAHIASNAIKVREDYSERRIMDMWVQFFEEVHGSNSRILTKFIGSGRALNKTVSYK